MAELQTYLDQLKGKFRKEEREPIIAEIANLGEAAIPSIIDAIRKNERVFDLTEALVQIGQASTLPLLDLFFEDFDQQTFIASAVETALRNLQDERVIEPFLHVFEEGDAERSWRAVRILTEVNDKRVAPKMIQLLTDTNTPERIKGSAIALLGLLNIIEARDLIASYLDNENLHLTVVMALYRLGDNRSVQPLRAKLLDEKSQYSLRVVLVRLIGEYPNHEFVPILLEMLNNIVETRQFSSNEYPTLHETLISTLGKLKDDRAVDLLMKIVYEGEVDTDTAVQAVAEIGSDYAIEQLINQLGRGFGYWDEYRMGHNRLVETVASLGESVIPRLTVIVNDRSENIRRRQAAAEALIELGGNRAVEVILKLFDDAVDLDVVNGVAWRLYKLHDARLYEPILRYVREHNGSKVSQILAEYATDDDLISLLQDDRYTVRNEAIEAVGLRSATHLAKYLVPLLPEHTGIVGRILAKFGYIEATEPLVGQVGKFYDAGKLAIQVGGNQAIQQLLKRLEEDDDKVRVGAAQGLAQAGIKEVVDAIYAALQKTKLAHYRLDILDALARLQDDRAIEELVGYVYSEPENRKGHAIRALGYFKKDEIAPIMRDILLSVAAYKQHRHLVESIIDSLKRRERVGFDALLECLSHPDATVVFEVVSALNIPIDKDKAINTLMPLLEDTRLVPNFSFNGLQVRICDFVAYTLKDYNIPHAQEIHEAWQNTANK